VHLLPSKLPRFLCNLIDMIDWVGSSMCEVIVEREPILVYCPYTRAFPNRKIVKYVFLK
jgi:hypothetical protein